MSIDQLFEYDYDGKPERRPIETTAEPAQLTRSTEPVLDPPARHADPDDGGDDGERGNATEAEEHGFGLADLRNMF